MSSSERAKKRPRTDSCDSDDTGRSEKLITDALEYLRAWEKRGEGSDWKFRKATQSFLLSALWRADVIPKTYFDIALEYLQGIQGRARDRLVQQASELVRATTLDAVREHSSIARSKSGAGDPPIEARLSRTKIKRAVRVLQVLL